VSKANKSNNNGIQHTLNVAVPDHWMIVSLEEVLEGIIGGGTPSKSNPKYWKGSIPWLTVKDMRTRRPEDSMDHITEVAVSSSATNVIPADTVIIATRIGLGKVIRVPYDAAINQDLKALIASEGVYKGYLEYWIVNIADYLASIGSGTTVKGIRLEQLRSLPFPLAPPKEQKRIVAEIEKQFSRLDEAVENLKRVKANLKRYKASVLKAAVEGKLTEEWREKRTLPAPKAGCFWVYVIKCSDESNYIGITDNLPRSWEKHRSGKSKKWTQKNQPRYVLHWEQFDSRQAAAKREKWFKTGFGGKWIKREEKAGRLRQAGDVEPAGKLLERILSERRKKWEEAELAKMYTKSLPGPKKGLWFIYVILCDDNSYYIGTSNDLKTSWTEHTAVQDAESTKSHKPIKIIHHEEFSTKKEVYKREKEFKTGFGRKWLKREFKAGRLRPAGKMPKDDKWKKKYKEPPQVDIRTLDQLPSGWHWLTSDQLFWFVTSGSRGWAKYYSDSGAVFLRIGNLDHDSVSLDLKKVQFVNPPRGAEGIRTRVEEKDILISITADVGMIGVIPRGFDEAYINQHISLARPVSSVNYLYIAWYLTSRLGQNQFKALQRGATKAGLGLDDIRSVNIPMPPFKEQEEIISQIEKSLSVVDKIEIEVDENIKQAERLRQSILKKAFSGRLISAVDEYESGTAHEMPMAAEAVVPYGTET